MDESNTEEARWQREQGRVKLFRDLSAEEEQVFRKWARDNYKRLSDISGVWHPVVQDECRIMNHELGSVEGIDLRGMLP